MVGEEIVVEGSDVEEDELERIICPIEDFPHLNLKKKEFSGGFSNRFSFSRDI
jgi:hypothetical protein